MEPKRLGELLITKNIITDGQLEEALAEQKRTGVFLAEILVRKGLATEEEVTLNLSEQLGLAYVDLAKYTVEPGIIKSLPEDIARKYLVLPLFKSATTVTVAMANPLDVPVIDEIQAIMKMRVRPVFAMSSQLSKRIEQEYHSPGAPPVISDVETIPIGQLDSVAIANLAPVVRIVSDLIAKAVELRASDIHLEPEGEHFYCRYRIDGILHDMPVLPKQYEAAIASRVKIMANMDISEKRLPQDGRIRMAAGNKNVDLRISTFPTMHGENVVIRILDKTRSLLKMEDLGMASDALKVFDEVIHKPHGMILVTGPTGSGKTTTLYTVLTRVNTTEKNIVTMEDPIEYEIERVRQSQVNVKAGLTFASGLRSLVRQDPNIIMIGEIRDHETAEIAIHAALTGHLVFTTLHTNDAPSAVTRMIDMGVEPFLVSSAVICIVAQRLVRVLCPSCKEPYQPNQEVWDELKMKSDPALSFYRAKGCRECREAGYTGRIGIFEIMIPDNEIRELIDRKASANEIRNCAVQKGMTTLREDSIDKLTSGITSFSEVLRATQKGQDRLVL